VQVLDLCEWWEGETGHPIPLGAILARRDLDGATVARVNETIRMSLDYAYAGFAAVEPYVREHAFEMDEAVMRAHIALYVNDYTRDIGDDGIAAVAELFELGADAGFIPRSVQPDFAP
jgi:1,4-dihydroxy-6-naphthoate synthase